MTRGRIVRTALLLVLATLILPAAASGQATRTWVSGVGDDVNPCSRTAPCKTFAGAISKTAAKGEINCLDPGGFGALTITKAISVRCHNTNAGVLTNAANAINVSAGVNDKVVLRGLVLNGLGTATNGIRINSAAAVKIYDTEIFGFGSNGVEMVSSTFLSRLMITRSDIHDNGGNGVLVAPPAGGNVTAQVSHTSLDDNACGATASGRLPTGAFGTNCGTGGGLGGTAVMNLFHNTIHEHRTGTGTGVFVNRAFGFIGDNAITGNARGINALETGTAAGFGLFSFGDNYIDANSTNGTPTGTVPRS